MASVAAFVDFFEFSFRLARISFAAFLIWAVFSFMRASISKRTCRCKPRTVCLWKRFLALFLFSLLEPPFTKETERSPADRYKGNMKKTHHHTSGSYTPVWSFVQSSRRASKSVSGSYIVAGQVSDQISVSLCCVLHDRTFSAFDVVRFAVRAMDITRPNA